MDNLLKNLDREEAREISFSWGNGDNLVVDEIFDYIDNMKCENCRDLHRSEFSEPKCMSNTSPVYYVPWEKIGSFHCSEFKSKEEEN